MKKTFFLLVTCISLGFSSFISAQESASSSRNLLPEESDYGLVNQSYNDYEINWKQNKFKDNWVLSLGGGAQVLFGEDDSKGNFSDRITFAPHFSITKYFRPSWGLRLSFSGGSLHGFNDGDSGIYRKWNHGSKNYLGNGYVGKDGYPQTPPNTAMLTWDPQWNYLGFRLGDEDVTKRINYISQNNVYQWNGANLGMLYLQRIRYIQVNLDFTFDLIGSIKGYDPKRSFEIAPFGGIGLYNAFAYYGNDNYLAAGIHGGLQFKFRLSERLGVNAEFNGSLVPDDFDGQSGDHTSMVGIGQAVASLSYKIGKTNWDVVDPVDYELIDNMNQQINQLRKDLDTQKNINETIILATPPVHPVEKVEEAPIKFLPDPVFFRINKSTIDNNQWESIDKAADYLNKYPDAKVVLTGYADKETGSPSYNMKLSERRAKNVAEVLVQRYGINPLRISVNWSGSQIQPFKINDWNRVVIFVIE